MRQSHGVVDLGKRTGLFMRMKGSGAIDLNAIEASPFRPLVLHGM